MVLVFSACLRATARCDAQAFSASHRPSNSPPACFFWIGVERATGTTGGGTPAATTAFAKLETITGVLSLRADALLGVRLPALKRVCSGACSQTYTGLKVGPAQNLRIFSAPALEDVGVFSGDDAVLNLEGGMVAVSSVKSLKKMDLRSLRRAGGLTCSNDYASYEFGDAAEAADKA